jgi:hypothetical protein
MILNKLKKILYLKIILLAKLRTFRTNVRRPPVAIL